MGDPWIIDASGGAPSYAGSEVRLGTVTPFVVGVGSSLQVRSGIRPSGSGTDLLVQSQVSPNMTVRVQPGVVVVQGATSGTQGAYTWALDATTNLAIGAAHATLSRTDRILVRIRDANVDSSGARDGAVIVWPGTAGAGLPALPASSTGTYFELARVTIPALATNIGGGGGQGTISDQRVFTTALGGVLVCTSATRPTATAVMPGQIIYESDTGRKLFSDSTQWRYVPGERLYSMQSMVYQAFGAGTTVLTRTRFWSTPDIAVVGGQAYDIEWQIALGSSLLSGTQHVFTTLEYSTNSGGAWSTGGRAPWQPMTAASADFGSVGRWTYTPASGITTVRFAITGNLSTTTAMDWGSALTPSYLTVTAAGVLNAAISAP